MKQLIFHRRVLCDCRRRLRQLSEITESISSSKQIVAVIAATACTSRRREDVKEKEGAGIGGEAEAARTSSKD